MYFVFYFLLCAHTRRESRGLCLTLIYLLIKRTIFDFIYVNLSLFLHERWLRHVFHVMSAMWNFKLNLYVKNDGNEFELNLITFEFEIEFVIFKYSSTIAINEAPSKLGDGFVVAPS